MNFDMRVKLYMVVLFVGLQQNLFSQNFDIKEGTKRIVFIGNSITYAGTYVSCIDAYFSMLHPQKKFEIINLGLPSETVSGLSEPNHAKGAFPRPILNERLDRLLIQTKPDLVFACYGMNDGIYLPFDKQRFEKFKNGIHKLHQAVTDYGAEIVHITPPVFDGDDNNSYARVLDHYTDWLIEQRNTLQWNVVDIHYPMKKELESQRVDNPTFAFAKDGIHPNEEGHFLMAKNILIYLGARELDQSDASIQNLIFSYPDGDQIFDLVKKRQQLLKDAWLTFIGHQRPKMNTGLPLEEAKRKAEKLKLNIKTLVKKYKSTQVTP